MSTPSRVCSWPTAVALILCTTSLPRALQPDTSTIAIFVGPTVSPEGFSNVDVGVRDSVRDLQNELRKKRGFVVTASESEALVVLRVRGRREGPNPNGPATLISFNILETEIEVGDYRKPLLVAFRGFGGVWKECAEQTVKELRVWVEANREAIHKNRVSRP